jgi:branched-chain amino acid transport system substrate-binding protein
MSLEEGGAVARCLSAWNTELTFLLRSRGGIRMRASYPAHLLCNVATPLAALLLACLVTIPLLSGCAEEEEETPTPGGTPTAAATGTVAPAGQVPGITDTEIIIGAHSPLSGAFGAVYSMIPRAQEAYYKYINETQGGVCGREIVFKVEDDNMDPAKGAEVTRKLVEGDKVFAIVGALGDLPHGGAWEYLNENEIPDILVSAGAHQYGADPQGHPWTVQMIPDYTIEGTFFGQHISENLPGKKVAVLYENQVFGYDGLAGVKNGLDPDKNEIVSEQSYESTAVSVRSQVTNMKNDGAEVVVLYATPAYTAQAVQEADRLGWHPQWMMSYVNSDEITFQFVSPQLMEGTISYQAYKMATWTDEPAIAEHYRIMQEYGGPSPTNFTVYAQSKAELSVEILSRTCDNLTREGLMEAVHSIEDWHSDLLLDEVNITFSETDHTALQTGRLLQVVLEDGKGRWEYFGPLYVFEAEVAQDE